MVSVTNSPAWGRPREDYKQQTTTTTKNRQRGGQWRSGNAPASNARGPGFDSQAWTDDSTKLSDCLTLLDESINRGLV